MSGANIAGSDVRSGTNIAGSDVTNGTTQAASRRKCSSAAVQHSGRQGYWGVTEGWPLLLSRKSVTVICVITPAARSAAAIKLRVYPPELLRNLSRIRIRGCFADAEAT
jgi:hypothetical protein